MGTWGVGSFDNDIALDWVGLLMEEEDRELIVLALKEISNEEEYIEEPECCEALAAAEVLVAIKRNNYERLPKELGEWLDKKMDVEKENFEWEEKIYLLGVQVVERILRDSELKELWSDSDEFEEWSKSIQELLGGLS